EALETRKVALSAVTKLDKPGNLQNGPRDILAPEGRVMTGDWLGQDAAYFPRHSGSGSTPRPRRPRRTSRGPPHRVPGPGGAGGPTRNDAELSDLTVEGGHSAMITRLELVTEAVRAALEELARTAGHALEGLVDDN